MVQYIHVTIGGVRFQHPDTVGIDLVFKKADQNSK